MSCQEVAHEFFAEGGIGRRGWDFRPPFGCFRAFVKVHTAKLAGVGEDQGTFLEGDYEVVVFGRSKRQLFSLQFAGHPQVNTNPARPAKLKEHLFAAGPGLAIGQAGEGAEEVFGVCASKNAGVWMDFNSNGALAEARVPLFAVILNFSQLRHARTIPTRQAGAIVVWFAMKLEVKPPFAPMEALSVDEVPVGEGWQYEPKWDGFRCLAFRDGEKVELQSKSGQSLTRYFPEVVEGLRGLKARRFVLDGELVIPLDGALSFDDLLQRIHPAESRVRKLAAATPALLIIFDLLADEKGKSVLNLPLKGRRHLLERFAGKYFKEPLRLSPMTTSAAEAKKWFHHGGASLDGVIAKRADLPYQSGERTGMQKIKAFRSADCVVGGFRYAEKGPVVGSLLLGLYDRDGLLHHVGFCSGIKAEEKLALTRKLEKLVKPPGFTGRAPGGPSRWSTKRSAEWKPLKPELVAEVTYDHVSGERFRHGTGFVRWRPDKAPKQCTMDQLKQKRSRALELLLQPRRK